MPGTSCSRSDRHPAVRASVGVVLKAGLGGGVAASVVGTPVTVAGVAGDVVTGDVGAEAVGPDARRNRQGDE